MYEHTSTRKPPSTPLLLAASEYIHRCEFLDDVHTRALLASELITAITIIPDALSLRLLVYQRWFILSWLTLILTPGRRWQKPLKDRKATACPLAYRFLRNKTHSTCMPKWFLLLRIMRASKRAQIHHGLSALCFKPWRYLSLSIRYCTFANLRSLSPRKCRGPTVFSKVARAFICLNLWPLVCSLKLFIVVAIFSIGVVDVVAVLHFRKACLTSSTAKILVQTAIK